ncbi:Nif3-like dinuclear metal center hexameric protein [Cardinium endosymbiont of Tipula unca]|uniref:Nif3-like dinuclear metal center hexameric protein n=1 Tax=Cardinium endosymbiont of Tipula unca TaxID=3066216 RepID=UPI0030CCFBFC
MKIESPTCSDTAISISDIVHYLEQTIQLCSEHTLFQFGLVVGNPQKTVTGILICLDITEELLDEAIEKKCNFIITNQPLLTNALHQVTPESYAGRCMIKAIQHNLAIYVFSTNLDHLGDGSSHRIANFLELQEMQPIVCEKQTLYKLTTFVPPQAEKDLINSLCQSGAMVHSQGFSGHLSTTPVGARYRTDSYGLVSNGTGTNLEILEETQLTFMLPTPCKDKVVQVLLHAHPYKKIPYYLESVETVVENRGSGVIGTLPVELPAKYFLKYVKTKLNLANLQHANVYHTNMSDKPIKTVAVYAGNGSQLLSKVLDKQMDVFITTGLQYEQFLEASGKVLIIDIGYYAARLGVKKLILALLSKEFNNIVILRCKTITNPIHYIND